MLLHLSEGPRYTVNRITFVGNTRTHDDVIRREMLLVEGALFSTVALRESLRRLNQLGYFKPLAGTEKEIQITKTVDREDAVDVKITLEEQDGNQLQYGGGVSQSDGLFGNLSYTIPNFLGGGESLKFFGQRGARSSMYQLSLTKPYLFNRTTAGVDLFSSKVDFLTGSNSVGYSEARSGISVTASHALLEQTRLSFTYAYEAIDTSTSQSVVGGLTGRYVESRITPSFVHNTVDNLLTPRQGRRITARAEFAGGWLGGTGNYIRPQLEVAQYIPHTRRTAIGLRANAGWLRPFGAMTTPPFHLRYFLGGENQIRGFDLRTVGPTDSENRVIGGDKYLLFNAEYYVDLHPRLRFVLFHDAGQAYSESQSIDVRQLRSSSGIELRVLVPKLNVPLRFIYGVNTKRDESQPARAVKLAFGLAW